MKTPFSLLLIVFGMLTINAQEDWEHHEIINGDELITNSNLFSINDIDGDGDLDIVSYYSNVYNSTQNEMFWYENLDGQGTYGPRKNIGASFHYLDKIITHDMDEDGDIDILYTYFYNNKSKISWLENIDGLGNFGNPIFIYERQESSIRNLTLADLDGDSDMDLIASFNNPRKVFWFENTGFPNFETPTIVTSNVDYLTDIIAVDMDGDNDLDIVVADDDYIPPNQNNYKIIWSENLDGQGNFGTAVPLTESTNEITTLTSVDIDNDGDMDLLANEGNSIILLKNINGAGNFSQPQTIYSTQDEIYFISVHDLDEDGDQDIITRDKRTNLIWLSNEGGGQGTFSQPVELASGFGNIILGEFAYVDDDAVKDFVSISSWSGFLTWHKLIQSSGTFEFAGNITPGIAYPTSVISADIDNDGNYDLLTSSFKDNSLAWYPNLTGDGSFPVQTIISNSSIGPRQIYAEDLDNDTDKDVLYFNDSEIGWVENTDGQGNFGPVEVILTSTSDIKSMTIGDIDNDGDQDIMFGTEDGKLYWTENIDNQNNFSSPILIFETFDSWLYVNSIKLADLDNDNNLDAIIGLFKKHEFSSYITLYWLKNIDGSGAFSNANQISTGMPSIYDIDTGDFDADGDLDIVSVGGEVLNDGSYIGWHENLDGLGDFSNDQIIWNNNGRPRSVQTVDMDADGDIDILMGASTVGRIAWFPNTDGLGAFSIRRKIKLTGGWAIYITAHAADLNNDGHVDVASNNARYNIVQWHENLGTLLTVTVEELEGFVLYPNPTQSIINFNAKNPVQEVRIYNELGQLVMDQTNSNGISTIDLQALSAGIYFLQVKDSKSATGIYKIIKE